MSKKSIYDKKKVAVAEVYPPLAGRPERSEGSLILSEK